MKIGLSRPRRGVERPLAACVASAAILLGGQAAARSASPLDVSLAATAALHGQPVRQLAVNLRGDEVLLLHDSVEEGRHLAIVKLSLRQPTLLLDIAQARSRLDEVSVDCAAGTRSLWRTEVYQAGDGGDQVPALNLPIPVEQRRNQPLTYLAVTDPLMAGALKVLCTSGGRLLRTSPPAGHGAADAPADRAAGDPAGVQARGPVVEPVPGPSAGGTTAQLPAPPGGNAGSPLPPGATTPAGRPDPEVPAGTSSRDPAPPPAVTPPAWSSPPGESIVNAPAFPGSAFTVRTLARLAAGTYIYPDRVQKEVDIEAVLAAVLADLDGRSQETSGAAQALTQASQINTQRAVDRLSLELEDKRSVLREAGLQAVELPALKTPPPGFRAELYRHAASGQYVLAFRGSSELGDWISNVWMGVDYGKITSPHYAAADAVVLALKRSGITPLVVGHSLGGGMAQYVGYRHKLRVVGFNPSPLPERYLSGQKYTSEELENVRLFTALELPRPGSQNESQHDLRMGDPLSLGLESFRRKHETIDRWVKANRQLVKPVCLLTQPEPYFDEYEDEQLAKSVGKYFATGPVQSLLWISKPKLLTAGAVAWGGKGALDRFFAEPIWAKVGGRHPEAAIMEAKRRIVLQSLKAAQATLGGFKAASWLFSAATGRGMGRTAAQITVGLTEMTAMLYMKRLLQVHGMQRFVRGLGVSGDLSPYQLTTDGDTPCAKVASSY